MWTEHPDLVERHFSMYAASIWLLEPLRRLELLPTTRVHRVKHCEFAGTAFKPTRLFAINMPTLCTRLNDQRKWRDPTTTLVGSDPTGQWRTAQAKAYPLGCLGALQMPCWMRHPHHPSLSTGTTSTLSWRKRKYTVQSSARRKSRTLALTLLTTLSQSATSRLTGRLPSKC